MRPIVLASTLALAACRGVGSSAEGPPDARESPQASAQPAQLAVAPTTPASASPNVATEAGPPPLPFRGDEELGYDTLSREAVGYALAAVLRPADPIGPPRAPEVNTLGIEAARKATELRLAIDLSPARMRLALLGHGFVLPPDAEIRARADRYGHLFVWGAGTSYRPLAPGTMRALLGERRFDVAPIAPAGVVQREEGGRRIGIRTRRVDVTTRAAQGAFEIGKLDGSSEGGPLLCRWLLDLMNAPPSTALCGTDELPVRAELRWTGHGALVFELTGAGKKPDIALSSLLVPPQGASLVPAPPAMAGVTTLLSAPELAAFRLNDVEIAPPHPPGDDLAVVNGTLALRMLYVDGVPVAWAAPGGRGEVRGLRRGRYTMQWRTFLGDVVDPPATLAAPGIVQVGVPTDAGAPRL